MKMKKILLLMSVLLISCQEQAEHSVGKEKHKDHKKQNHIETYYTCSMHPQVREDRPGKCPICAMGLTKIEVEEGSHDLISDVSTGQDLKKIYFCESDPSVTSEAPGECPLDGSALKERSVGAQVVAQVKLRKSQMKHFKADTFPVTTMKMAKDIRLLGSVMKSEERESNIPAQIPGRVEEVLIESTGSFVRRGDPVLKLYSPKLLAGGEEYLIARKNHLSNMNNADFKDLYVQSRQRLKLWGILDKQLAQWESKGRIPREITIYSDVTGIVEKKNAINGKYFKEGESFFDLVDLSTLWVELDVYEHDSALVKLGQTVEMNFSAHPGELWEGKIDFISPVLDEKTRTLKIRTTLDNGKGMLKPGMVGSATVKLERDGMPLVIPRSAVIDTGIRKVVWLQKGNHTYQANLIETGFESSGFIEVKSGLKENDHVVIEGNFLLDAQAQLFGGYSGKSN